MFRLLFLLLIILVFFNAKGEHLVGGDIGYICLGNNNFVVDLNVYRDCKNSQTPLDNPAYITIYNNDTRSSTSIAVGLFSSQFVPLNNLGPCVQTAPSVCIEAGNYKQQVTLTPNNNGYLIVYQRCCRNNSILNLSNSGTQGTTYAIQVPKNAFTTCNTTPKFTNSPPIALCVNETLTFDYSATDADGDSLVYSLCPPLQGADQTDPAPSVASSPPYEAVFYNSGAGYSESSPMGALNAISIDTKTGLLTVTPPQIGLFVIGTCVSEYRNGSLLSQHFRDFQFNVANCNIARAKISFNEFLNCKDSTITFVNQSSGNFTNYWEFILPSGTQSSTQSSPVFSYPDTGTYLVKLVINRGQTCADSTTATVKIYPAPTASFTANTACEKDQAVLFNNTSASPLNDISGYSWKFGNGITSTKKDTSIVYTSSGIYTVDLSVVTANGCKDTLVQQVFVNPKPVASFSPDAACEDVSVTLNNTSQSSIGISAAAWALSGNSTSFNSSDINPVFTFFDQGIYSVTLAVTDSNGCKDTIQKDLQVFPPISAAFVPDKSSICAGEQIVFSNLSSGIIDQFIWIYGDGTTNGTTNDSIHSYMQAGNFTAQLVAVNNACGRDTAEAILTVTPTPTINIASDKLSICSGDTTSISIASVTAVDSLVWNTGQSGTIIQVTEPGIYTVTAYKDGCSNRDSIDVNAFCLVFVPSAFSPNGDGKNEGFNVIDKNIETFSLTIYNRWNELIFNTTDLKLGWNGTYKGALCPVDAYIYHVSGIKTDGVPFEQKGVVSLFR